MSVELPCADTLVPAQLAADVLGSVLGQHYLVRGDEVGGGVVYPVGSSQVRLQVTGQLGVCGESFLAEFTLKFLHVNKLDVVPEGLGHDQTVRTLRKLRTGTVTGLIMNRELGCGLEQLEASLALDGVAGRNISNTLRVIIIPFTHVIPLRVEFLVNSVTVLFEELHRGEGHPTVPAVKAGPQQAEGGGPGSSPVRELDVEILVNVSHVRLPVLLGLELAVGTERAGEPLGGVDRVHVLVPTLLLHELLTKITKLGLLLVILLEGALEEM